MRIDITDDIRRNFEGFVKEAGAIVMSYFNHDLTRNHKSEGGFATEADIASEQFLIKNLLNIVPDAAIWAEESGKKNGQNDYCWVIDPIDGTTNYSRRLPHFCISVALTYKGVPEMASVYQPLLKEFFYAERGKGATLNGVPIKVSAPALKQSLVVVGLPYAKDKIFCHLTMGGIRDISLNTYGIRHFGAAALDLAYAACGKVDGVCFEALSWWDVAAGILLVQEAGGIVTDFEGNQVDSSYKTLVAAGSGVHQQLFKLIRAAN